MSYTKPNDWTEDFADENGNYANECLTCKKMFRGHKRRTMCKVCATETPIPDIELTHLQLVGNTLEIAAKHPLATKIIEAMVEMLDDMGGENYVSMAGYSPKTKKQYEIIVKYLDGVLPATKAASLQMTVDLQAKEIATLRRQIRQLTA